MQKVTVFNLKNRKKIYDFIFEYPGLHLRKIIKELKLSEGTVRYHIKYLIDHDLILKFKKNGYTRFYVTNENNMRDKKIISYLRNDNTRLIILFYCFCVCGSLKKICRFLDKDKKEISIYIKKLLEDDIIEVAPVNGYEVSTSFKKCKKKIYNVSKCEKIYRLKNPYELYDILISLKNKYFDDGTTDELLDLLNWIYHEKKNRSKTIDSDKNIIQRIEDLAYDLFPVPFCA